MRRVCTRLLQLGRVPQLALRAHGHGAVEEGEGVEAGDTVLPVEPLSDAELYFLLQEVRLRLFAEPLALQKRRKPAFVGSESKVSLKRVEEKIRREEQRVGLA